MAPNPILEAALSYAQDRGWFVFPVDAKKHPLTKWGLGGVGQRATIDENVIRDWFACRFRNAFIAIATGPSGLFVVDKDLKHGGSLAMLEVTYGRLPFTLAATTPSSRGTIAHLVYAATPKQGSRNSVSRLLKGIDTRGRGGFVVAPPAPGRAWIDPSVPVAPAPACLLEELNRPRRSDAPNVAPGRFSPDDLADALERLDPEDFDDNGSWEPLLMSAHDAAGGDVEARELFLLWSLQDSVFSDCGDEIRARWDSLRPGRSGNVTERLLIGKVLEADPSWKPPGERPENVFSAVPGEPSVPMLERQKGGRPKNTLRNALQAVRALALGPSRNELEERTVLKATHLPWSHPGLGQVWGSDLLRVLREHLLRQFGLEVSREHLDEAVETIALERRFNPLVEYLSSLTWDGEPRLDRWLVTYAGAEDSAYTRAVGRITLLGAVARAYVAGVKFDTMLVLEGLQGSEKSSLVQSLAGEWASEGMPPGDLRGKDAVASLLGKWIVEIQELEAVRRSDIATLKSFLSAQIVRARLPYEPKARDYPRRCIFVGTTNDASYLRDQTGNRRFLPVATRRIDLAAAKRDRDCLWAEAVREWKADPRPERLVLPKALWSTAAKEQEERRTPDPWEEVVESYLSKLEAAEVSTAQLLFDACGKAPRDATKVDEMRLADAMQHHGWRRARIWVGAKNERQRVRGYRRASP